MNILEILPKELAIVIILSPLFLLFIALVILIKQGFKKAQKHSQYWFLASLLLSGLYVWNLVEGASSTTLFGISSALTTSIAIYQKMKRV